MLKSARVRRERYVGEWLPEPIVHGDGGADPADRVTLDDSVSMAMLVVFESLSPAERTAFVLHDVFKLPFVQVAEAVGRSPAACRQLAARARAHVEARAPRFDPDVVLRSDGGGKVSARPTPMQGAEQVARFVLAIAAARTHMRQHVRTVNGQPGLVTTEDGDVVAVMGFEAADGRITEIDLVMNPDKLPRDASGGQP